MPHASDRSHAVEAQLAFTRIENVSRDDERRGLLRARTLDLRAMADPRSHDLRTCRVMDCAAGGFRPDLREHGFAHVDLSRMHRLQDTLERIRVADRLGEEDAADIRRRLIGRALPLASGARLWVLFIASEGFFMRRAGPNGAPIGRDASGADSHDAAMTVHADQDVDGTPVRQILRGAAPWLFHHDSPARSNRLSRLHLVNLWIPLDQVTRPLALMDRRTLNRRAHQLRHGLPTDTFLRRDEGMRVNDIWSFLHDESQQWYFTSDLDARTAYAFDTLSTPHGAFILPGEELAEARYRQLTAAVDAVQRRDHPGVVRALSADDRGSVWREPATAPLRRAIAAMEAMIEEGRANAPALCRGEAVDGWTTRAAGAARRVVRKSLEMRAIALLTPAVWPFRAPRVASADPAGGRRIQTRG